MIVARRVSGYCEVNRITFAQFPHSWRYSVPSKSIANPTWKDQWSRKKEGELLSAIVSTQWDPWTWTSSDGYSITEAYSETLKGSPLTLCFKRKKKNSLCTSCRNIYYFHNRANARAISCLKAVTCVVALGRAAQSSSCCSFLNKLFLLPPILPHS